LALVFARIEHARIEFDFEPVRGADIGRVGAAGEPCSNHAAYFWCQFSRCSSGEANEGAVVARAASVSANAGAAIINAAANNDARISV